MSETATTPAQPGQIIRKLREAERLLAEGRKVPEVAKALEVSGQTLELELELTRTR